MKKIVLFIIMLFSATAMAQQPGWTTLKETNITVGTNAYDIFTNGAGNHIIVQANDENPKKLKYYRMKVDGSYDIGPTNIETSEVFSPSISGDLTKIYVVYRKTNNKITTKYSGDGGVNWSYLPDLNTPEGNAISIECAFSRGNLHVTFLIGTTVYFNYYNTNTTPPSWLTQHFTISDHQINSAANPRISINSGGSVDTVYFVWNPSSSTLSWRRYVVGEISPQQIRPSIIGGSATYHIGFAIDNSYLYSFYKYNSTSILQWNVRRIWNNGYIGTGNSNGNTSTTKIFSTTTFDNLPYTAAWDQTNTQPGIYRMRGNPNIPIYFMEYDNIYWNSNLSPVNIVNLSAAGKDVHVVWKDNLGSNNGNNLRYKYYDDIPIPPQNLTITKSANNHPLLSWNANPEPDLYNYQVWKKGGDEGGDWHLKVSTPNTYYEDPDEIVITGPKQANEGMAYYYVKAVDLGSHVSGSSNEVNIRVGIEPPSKSSAGDEKLIGSIVYSLQQNYPNPFNPTTTINYSIKSAGDVSLKVYDILGTEVATLVNEELEPGNYSVTFDAANLPSGMYVYILSTDNFIETKKLILLK